MQDSGSEGMGEVIAIINGGYDCCLSSTYGTRYGHTTDRVWWFIDIYKSWTGNLPFETLNPVPLNDCPLA